MENVIGFIVLIFLLALSAFFSSAETAFTTVNKVRIRALAEEGNRRAKVVQKILDDHSRMLSAILVGNNLVNISSSSLATTLAIDIWGNYAIGIMTGLLTLFVLLLGEITPKNWAMANAEKISLAYSDFVYLFMIVFTPVIFIVNMLSKLILLILHVNTDNKSDLMTEKDLKTYVDVSHEDGAIEKEEKEMIYNVFDFSDSKAKDIMIPKIDITMIDSSASYNELLETFKESMYTRVPVYDQDSDNVIGIVNVKDFLFVTNKKAFQIKDILREAYYTYEYKKTADLMMEMQKSSANVAFVIDEYGACVGMITLEDLIEEIVGEIRDEYDEDEAELIKEISPRQYLVEGSMKLDDINNALGIDLSFDDYDSIGGLLIGALDHLPKEGERVAMPDGTVIGAQEISQNRVEKALLILPEPADENEEDSDRQKEHGTQKEHGANGDEPLKPMTLESGRPLGTDADNLPEKEMRCYDLLDKLGISYEQTHHKPLFTVPECADVEKLLGTEISKNLFLCNRQESEFYLLVMPGSKKFQTKVLSSQLNVSRLSFAPADKMKELLGVEPGSVTVFGLMNDSEFKVHFLMDKDILNQEYFACHPLINTASVKMKTKDLTDKLIPALGHEVRYVELS